MGFHVRPSAAALAVVLSAVALSGCTGAGGAYSVLEREAEARDEVPADLPGYAWDDVDQATARFVGEGDGTPCGSLALVTMPQPVSSPTSTLTRG